MSYIQLLILIFVVFLAIFAIVDRVCRCFEQCKTADAFRQFVEIGANNDQNKEDENP